jgi:FKBP-type peptidyl-prolyl cis-trans isomerase FklB
MAGFVSGIKANGLMTVDSAQVLAQSMMSTIKAKELEKTYGGNKEAGEKFLAANKTKEGVKTLPSGVQYKVIKEGNGPIPADTSLVKVHYEGKTVEGKVFDSSIQRGEPATFPLQQVIAGWTEGLQLMQEGAKYRFFIPYRLGYGEGGAGNSIPPFAALIFDVELIQVV